MKCRWGFSWANQFPQAKQCGPLGKGRISSAKQVEDKCSQRLNYTCIIRCVIISYCNTTPQTPQTPINSRDQWTPRNRGCGARGPKPSCNRDRQAEMDPARNRQLVRRPKKTTVSQLRPVPLRCLLDSFGRGATAASGLLWSHLWSRKNFRRRFRRDQYHWDHLILKPETKEPIWQWNFTASEGIDYLAWCSRVLKKA